MFESGGCWYIDVFVVVCVLFVILFNLFVIWAVLVEDE